MGIFNDTKTDKRQSLCKQGPKGDPGLSIKGNPGKNAVLPNNILLDTGFVMKADIDMDLHEIINLKYPSLPNSASTKSYVDNNKILLPADLVKTSNASFVTDVKMNDNRLTGLKSPLGSSDAIPKKYLEELKLVSENDARFLNTDGTNPMADSLNMNNNKIISVGKAISSNDAISLGHVNTIIGVATAPLINRNGDTFFGNIDMTQNRILNLKLPIDDSEVSTKEYVDSHLISQNVMLLDGSIAMTGNLNLNDNRLINLKLKPEDERDAVCKKYIDEKQIQLKLNDIQDPNLHLPPPFNYTSSHVSGLYSVEINNEIYYGSTLPTLIAYNVFNYYPSQNEKITSANSAKNINFVDFNNLNQNRILSGYGIQITINKKNSIVLRRHILHEINLEMFFEHWKDDIEYVIKVNNNIVGLPGHTRFLCRAHAIFGSNTDATLTISTVNSLPTARLEFLRLTIKGIASYRDGYFGLM